MCVRACVCRGTLGKDSNVSQKLHAWWMRGPCESERVDWAPASRPWAERVAACVERPHRSSQHWAQRRGPPLSSAWRTARALRALPAQVCVEQPLLQVLLFLLFSPPPCPLCCLSCSPSLPNPPLTSLSERAGVGGVLTHPHPWVPAVSHPRASALPRADLSPPQQGWPLAAGP